MLNKRGLELNQHMIKMWQSGLSAAQQPPKILLGGCCAALKPDCHILIISSLKIEAAAQHSNPTAAS
ncbi:hypothetical protein TWF730_003438 [Orbilia blumenaviensis]|uniref:Uncharacterized protein n=1 Tax=Orbilia blumenaviensis TaxID=1796055 RepID=A0AAV9U6Y4_9PEZI